MEKDGSITIDANDFVKGISNSRYTGFEHMRNLDPFSKRGSLRIMPAMTAESDADIPTSALLAFSAVDPNSGNIFFATNSTDTNIYKYDGSSWSVISGATSGACRGLVIANNYLFRVRNSGGNSLVDRYGDLSGTPSWSNSWGTIRSSETSTRVPTIYGQDGIIYFGIKNKLSSISDVTSPGSINTNALDLPAGYNIQSLAELGANLMVGATMGDSVSSVGDIFPWDRVSSSFELPIQTGLQGIPVMYTKNNLIYAIGGKYGQVFVTNGTSVEQSFKLSELTDDAETAMRTPSTDCIDAWNSGIVLGIGKSAGTDNGPCGVWILRDGALFFQTLSFGQTDADGFEIGSIVALDDYSLLVCWGDLTNNVYGVDVTTSSKRYTSYSAYLDTKIYQVGTRIKPKTFQGMHIKLANPLSSGGGIKVSYRLNSSDSFTEIDSFEYGSGSGADNDNLGAIISIDHTPMNIPKCESIQFRIALTATGSTSSTPELEYVEIY